jgi:hypothetical protein
MKGNSAGKSQNSLFHDVKRELGLPLLRRKMLFIPITFTICYNVPRIFIYFTIRKAKGWMGEKVVLSQLEVEKQRNHNLTHEIYNGFAETAYIPMVIEKSEAVMTD